MKKLLLSALLLGYISQSYALFDFNNWSTEMKVATVAFTGFGVCVGLGLYIDEKKNDLRNKSHPQATIFNSAAARTRSNTYEKWHEYDAKLGYITNPLFYAGVGCLVFYSAKTVYNLFQDAIALDHEIAETLKGQAELHDELIALSKKYPNLVNIKF